MKMKTILPLSVITAMLCMYGCSCGSTTDTYLGDFVYDYNAGGPTRTEGVSFTINNVPYITTGFNGSVNTATLGNNLLATWAYDTTVNSWIQKADFPGAYRYSAVAFTANGKGYVGTGFDGTTMYNDFFAYNPATNTWSASGAIPIMPGTPRYDAAAFAIGNIGYVGTGYDNSYQNDFYRYDAVANTWSSANSTGAARMPNLAGSKRKAATAWTLNGKGYICAGINSGTTVNELWEFNPAQGLYGTWNTKRALTNKTDSSFDDLYTGIVRENGIAMVINNQVFLMSGDNGSALTSTWLWDPINDQWTVQQPMGGTEAPARTGAVVIQLGNRGFVCTGSTGVASGSYYNDLWEFLPGVQVNPNN